MYFTVPVDIYEAIFEQFLPEPVMIERFAHLLPYNGGMRAPELIVYSTQLTDAFSIRYFNLHGHEERLLPIPFERNDLAAIKASMPYPQHVTISPSQYSDCSLFAYLLELHAHRVTGGSPYNPGMSPEQQDLSRRIMYDNLHKAVEHYRIYLDSLRCSSHDYTTMAQKLHLLHPCGEIPQWRDVMVAA